MSSEAAHSHTNIKSYIIAFDAEWQRMHYHLNLQTAMLTGNSQWITKLTYSPLTDAGWSSMYYNLNLLAAIPTDTSQWITKVTYCVLFFNKHLKLECSDNFDAELRYCEKLSNKHARNFSCPNIGSILRQHCI